MKQKPNSSKNYPDTLSNFQITDLESHNMYGLIQGTPYSYETLNKKFKRLAAKYHPDKPTGDTCKFLLIKEAYFYLYNKKQKEEYEQRTHHELVDTFKKEQSQYGFSQNQSDNSQQIDNARPFSLEDLKENKEKFNQFFEQTYQDHHIPNRQGYGHLMNNQDTNIDIQKDPSITKQNFNDVFINKANTAKKNQMQFNQNKSLIPQQAQSDAQKGMILGQGSINDFSSYSGPVKYYDYLLAFSTPDIDYSKTNKNGPKVSLQQARNLRNSLNPEQLVNQPDDLYSQYQKQLEDQENKRLYNLQKQQEIIDQQYQAMQNLILQ